MRARYVAFDPRERALDERHRHAKDVYQHLLLMANGEVERALEWLERVDRRHGFFDDAFTLEDFRRRLEREGLVERTRGGARLKLSTGGEIRLRRDALERIFSSLARGDAGEHRTAGTGPGHERLSETRPWTFGDDPSEICARTTLRNAMRRSGPDLELREEDFEVFETEARTACATVIAIDVSHSMTLYGEDRITPAKQVALALVELIRTRFPRDDLQVVLFGDDAVEVPLDRIPYVGNGPYHTNTREGLRLASRLLLRRRHPNRQVFMITDGKPSALTEDDGTIYKNPFGLDDRVVNKTVEEAAALRRRGIVVTTFMLTDDPTLVRFVEEFTRTNRGRAYYASADRLGSFLLVDYLRNRRRTV
ncbi:MAG: VWA domain-containing protein [Planctomycetota bacterium JB042]